MSVLAQVRKQLMSKKGLTEQDLLSEGSGITELWNQLQDLKVEMNAAKRLAAQEAEKPFLDAIAEIERSYAIYLKLQAR